MSDDEQEIILIPTDENGRVLLFSDVKIENIDANYRTIRDATGLNHKLPPGKYNVKIFLRSLQIKTVALTVTEGVSVYNLPVETGVAVPQAVPAPAAPPPPSPSPVVERTVVPPAQSSKSGERRQPTGSGARNRVPITFPVSYRTDAGKWLKAKTLNVSDSGLCIETSERVAVDETLYVRLHVPAATIPLECPARVVWVKMRDSRSPCIGIQLFLTSNMRESLDRWLVDVK